LNGVGILVSSWS